MNRVEKQTGWNADQFKRRVKRFVQLPACHSLADLEAIARALLPNATKPMLKFLVAYASSLSHQNDGLVDAVREAKLAAEAAGRAEVSFLDVERAVNETLLPTEQAKTLAFQEPSPARRSKAAQRLQAGGKAAGAIDQRNEALENEVSGNHPGRCLRTANGRDDSATAALGI